MSRQMSRKCRDAIEFTVGTVLDQSAHEICLDGLHNGQPCTGDSDCDLLDLGYGRGTYGPDLFLRYAGGWAC